MATTTTDDALLRPHHLRAPTSSPFHPLPNLLDLTAEQILGWCRRSQQLEFTSTLNHIRSGGTELSAQIHALKRYLEHFPSARLHRRLGTRALEQLFLSMHDHVMAHPVWVHPFFVRVARGDIDSEQLRRFARHYFNQVKNTRQCVALALGRFHTMLARPDAEQLNVVLAELTQVVLAGLLADEYGTAHDDRQRPRSVPDNSPLVDVGAIFSGTTHPELFRRFLSALGDDERDYDVPMLHGVADNVLVQRIVSGNAEFDELEALASVGLGMEWGVPAFFSMIIAGILKAAPREGLVLDEASMEIWSAHVRQDVEHAIAVMVATGFYVDDERDVARIEDATNILMAFRYNMMTDIYREIFDADCPDVAEAGLEQRYFLRDSRIERLLTQARRNLRPGSVRDYPMYLHRNVALPLA